MDIFQADILFLWAIGLFIAAALISIIFSKNHRLCNTLTNYICVAGSIVGIAAALLHILRGIDKLVLLSSKAAVPFIELNITIDKLSAYFLMALFVLVIAVSVYSIGYTSHYYNQRNVGLFNLLYATFILSMIMVIASGNSVFFFMAWEIMSVLSYFLVVFEHEKTENCKAGTVYIIMTHLGAAFLLISFLIIYSYTGSFNIFADTTAMPQSAKNLVFIFLLIGFGTKAGIIPFHIWLPKAHPAASSNVSALMSGIMIKTAIYGIVRFVAGTLGISSGWWGTVILCLGIVAAVLGVAFALMEHNIKRLLAFHSIENIGIIFIGLGVSFTAVSMNNYFVAGLALLAALFHTLNHALFKGGLFLGAGAIQYATHTKDIEELGGLIKKMPYTALFVLCFSLAISAIVPFNGFASEWLTYQSIFAELSIGTTGINVLTMVAAAALALAGALAAVCFVKLFGITFLGAPRTQVARDAKEVPKTMLMGMGILSALCLALGLFPIIIIKILDRVLADFANISVAEQIQGGFIVPYVALDISGSRISSLAVVLVAAVLIIAVAFAIRITGGKTITRPFGTWDCGFVNINERMQYSATGFSKPIRIVLRMLYRPSRKLETTGANAPYFPETMEYKVSTEPVFEKYMYNPFVRKLRRLSLRVRLSVQTGSMHLYLFYILLTVLVLMLYNRLF